MQKYKSKNKPRPLKASACLESARLQFSKQVSMLDPVPPLGGKLLVGKNLDVDSADD